MPNDGRKRPPDEEAYKKNAFKRLSAILLKEEYESEPELTSASMGVNAPSNPTKSANRSDCANFDDGGVSARTRRQRDVRPASRMPFMGSTEAGGALVSMTSKRSSDSQSSGFRSISGDDDDTLLYDQNTQSRGAKTNRTTQASQAHATIKRVQTSPPAYQRVFREPPGSKVIVTCTNCSVTWTKLWREDENGNILCDSCGLYRKMYGTSKPIGKSKQTDRSADASVDYVKENERTKRKVTPMTMLSGSRKTTNDQTQADLSADVSVDYLKENERTKRKVTPMTMLSGVRKPADSQKHADHSGDASMDYVKENQRTNRKVTPMTMLSGARKPADTQKQAQRGENPDLEDSVARRALDHSGGPSVHQPMAYHQPQQRKRSDRKTQEQFSSALRAHPTDLNSRSTPTALSGPSRASANPHDKRFPLNAEAIEPRGRTFERHESAQKYSDRSRSHAPSRRRRLSRTSDEPYLEGAIDGILGDVTNVTHLVNQKRRSMQKQRQEETVIEDIIQQIPRAHELAQELRKEDDAHEQQHYKLLKSASAGNLDLMGRGVNGRSSLYTSVDSDGTRHSHSIKGDLFHTESRPSHAKYKVESDTKLDEFGMYGLPKPNIRPASHVTEYGEFGRRYDSQGKLLSMDDESVYRAPDRQSSKGKTGGRTVLKVSSRRAKASRQDEESEEAYPHSDPTDDEEVQSRSTGFLKRAAASSMNSMEPATPGTPPSPSLGRKARPPFGENRFLGPTPYKKLLNRAILPRSKSSATQPIANIKSSVEHHNAPSTPSRSFSEGTPAPDITPGQGLAQSKRRRESKRFKGSPLEFDPRNSAEVERFLIETVPSLTPRAQKTRPRDTSNYSKRSVSSRMTAELAEEILFDTLFPPEKEDPFPESEAVKTGGDLLARSTARSPHADLVSSSKPRRKSMLSMQLTPVDESERLSLDKRRSALSLKRESFGPKREDSSTPEQGPLKRSQSSKMSMAAHSIRPVDASPSPGTMSKDSIISFKTAAAMTPTDCKFEAEVTERSPLQLVQRKEDSATKPRKLMKRPKVEDDKKIKSAVSVKVKEEPEETPALKSRSSMWARFEIKERPVETPTVSKRSSMWDRLKPRRRRPMGYDGAYEEYTADYSEDEATDSDVDESLNGEATFSRSPLHGLPSGETGSPTGDDGIPFSDLFRPVPPAQAESPDATGPPLPADSDRTICPARSRELSKAVVKTSTPSSTKSLHIEAEPMSLGPHRSARELQEWVAEANRFRTDLIRAMSPPEPLFVDEWAAAAQANRLQETLKPKSAGVFRSIVNAMAPRAVAHRRREKTIIAKSPPPCDPYEVALAAAVKRGVRDATRAKTPMVKGIALLRTFRAAILEANAARGSTPVPDVLRKTFFESVKMKNQMRKKRAGKRVVQSANTWIKKKPKPGARLIEAPLEQIPRIYKRNDLLFFSGGRRAKAAARKPADYDLWVAVLPEKWRPWVPPQIKRQGPWIKAKSKSRYAPKRASGHVHKVFYQRSREDLKALSKAIKTPLPKQKRDELNKLVEPAPLLAPPKRAYRRAVSSQVFSMIADVKLRPRSYSEPASTDRFLRMDEQVEAEEESSKCDVESLQALLLAPEPVRGTARAGRSETIWEMLDRDENVAKHGGAPSDGLVEVAPTIKRNELVKRSSFQSPPSQVEIARPARTVNRPFNSSSITEPQSSVTDSVLTVTPALNHESLYSNYTSYEPDAVNTQVPRIQLTAATPTPSVGDPDEAPLVPPSEPTEDIVSDFIDEDQHRKQVGRPTLLGLPSRVRYQIYQNLCPPTTARPVLLSPVNTVSWYWAQNAFMDPSAVFMRICAAMQTCHQLHDELLSFYLTQFKFHITLNFRLKPTIAPKLFKWVPPFVNRIEDLTIELDFTKGAGDYRDHRGMCPTGYEELRQLLKMVIEPMAKRETPIKKLHIMVRRYDGCRPSGQEVPVDAANLRESWRSVIETDARGWNGSCSQRSAMSWDGDGAQFRDRRRATRGPTARKMANFQTSKAAEYFGMQWPNPNMSRSSSQGCFHTYAVRIIRRKEFHPPGAFMSSASGSEPMLPLLSSTTLDGEPKMAWATEVPSSFLMGGPRSPEERISTPKAERKMTSATKLYHQSLVSVNQTSSPRSLMSNTKAGRKKASAAKVYRLTQGSGPVASGNQASSPLPPLSILGKASKSTSAGGESDALTSTGPSDLPSSSSIGQTKARNISWADDVRGPSKSATPPVQSASPSIKSSSAPENSATPPVQSGSPSTKHASAPIQGAGTSIKRDSAPVQSARPSTKDASAPAKSASLPVQRPRYSRRSTACRKPSGLGRFVKTITQSPEQQLDSPTTRPGSPPSQPRQPSVAEPKVSTTTVKAGSGEIAVGKRIPFGTPRPQEYIPPKLVPTTTIKAGSGEVAVGRPIPFGTPRPQEYIPPNLVPTKTSGVYRPIVKKVYSELQTPRASSSNRPGGTKSAPPAKPSLTTRFARRARRIANGKPFTEAAMSDYYRKRDQIKPIPVLSRIAAWINKLPDEAFQMDEQAAPDGYKRALGEHKAEAEVEDFTLVLDDEEALRIATDLAKSEIADRWASGRKDHERRSLIVPGRADAKRLDEDGKDIEVRHLNLFDRKIRRNQPGEIVPHVHTRDNSGQVVTIAGRAIPAKKRKLRVPYTPHEETEMLDILIDHLKGDRGPGVLLLRLSGFPRQYTLDIAREIIGFSVVQRKPPKKAWPKRSDGYGPAGKPVIRRPDDMDKPKKSFMSRLGLGRWFKSKDDTKKSNRSKKSKKEPSGLKASFSRGFKRIVSSKGSRTDEGKSESSRSASSSIFARFRSSKTGEPRAASPSPSFFDRVRGRGSDDGSRKSSPSPLSGLFPNRGSDDGSRKSSPSLLRRVFGAHGSDDGSRTSSPSPNDGLLRVPSPDSPRSSMNIFRRSGRGDRGKGKEARPASPSLFAGLRRGNSEESSLKSTDSLSKIARLRQAFKFSPAGPPKAMPSPDVPPSPPPLVEQVKAVPQSTPIVQKKKPVGPRSVEDFEAIVASVKLLKERNAETFVVAYDELIFQLERVKLSDPETYKAVMEKLRVPNVTAKAKVRNGGKRLKGDAAAKEVIDGQVSSGMLKAATGVKLSTGNIEATEANGDKGANVRPTVAKGQRRPEQNVQAKEAGAGDGSDDKPKATKASVAHSNLEILIDARGTPRAQGSVEERMDALLARLKRRA